LIYDKKITLLEALSGYEFLVTHLDDRAILVRSSAGDITKHGDIRVVPNEGMPLQKNPFQKGNLFIRFVVEWPTSGSLTPTHIELLSKALPPKPELRNVPMDVEEVTTEPFDEVRHNQTNHQQGYGGRGEAYDEDEQQPQGGCVHQ